jgi:thiol-disulfide isomerase/thioredoxin
MGKADRNRRESAREKIAAQQAAERRAQKRRQILMAGGSVVAVLAIVVVLIVVKSLNKTSAGSNVGTASASTVSKLTSVPAATLASVNKGSANPKTLIPITGTALTANGKPEVLYMGAEYCPFCATERWAMTVALSRFGTFSGLSFIHSSGTDTPASIPTLTFYKSTYTSKYVDFQPVEIQGTTEGKALQTPTAEQSALFAKWDAPPYVPANEKGSFPFVDFANQYLVLGAQYNPQDLSKLTWSQVAADMADPSSKVAADIDSAANSITAAICKITKNAPAAICTSPAVQAGEGLL